MRIHRNKREVDPIEDMLVLSASMHEFFISDVGNPDVRYTPVALWTIYPRAGMTKSIRHEYAFEYASIILAA